MNSTMQNDAGKPPFTAIYLKTVERARNKNLIKMATRSFAELHQAMKTALKTGNLTLCLGAGVSVCSGFPGWLELMTRIAEDALPPEQYQTLSEIFLGGRNLNLLTTARFLRNRFLLHASLPYFVQGAIYLTANHDAENAIMSGISELVKLCVEQDVKLTILTYNFDDLLEYYIRKMGLLHHCALMVNAKWLGRLLNEIRAYLSRPRFFAQGAVQFGGFW